MEIREGESTKIISDKKGDCTNFPDYQTDYCDWNNSIILQDQHIIPRSSEMLLSIKCQLENEHDYIFEPKAGTLQYYNLLSLDTISKGKHRGKKSQQ